MGNDQSSQTVRSKVQEQLEDHHRTKLRVDKQFDQCCMRGRDLLVVPVVPRLRFAGRIWRKMKRWPRQRRPQILLVIA